MEVCPVGFNIDMHGHTDEQVVLLLTLQCGVTGTVRHRVNITCCGVTNTGRHAAHSHLFVYISTT